MRRILLTIGFLFTFYLALTPPGLCPCWLMFDPAANHLHFDNNAQQPHDHGYLLDYFQSQALAVVSLILEPIALLISLQAASGLWRRIVGQFLPSNSWALDPLTPPPRWVLGLN